MKFIDEAKVVVEAGSGGNGCVSFRREKYIPRGGPDGGNGGQGGDVILCASTHRDVLSHLQLPLYTAGDGAPGGAKNCSGRGGRDLVLDLPAGTRVIDLASGLLLKDLAQPGARIIVARGGRGGRGNRHFASSTNRTPRQAEEGLAGEERRLRLDLKTISDVGIVGFPNAGKSTLLKALTSAVPAIADYPFTTLTPNLGVLKSGLTSIVIADLPGIIEGAHAGKGLGLRFLRHIERTGRIILLIDASAADPQRQYLSLLSEFEKYGGGLLEKPRLVVFNKIDRLGQTTDFKIEEEVYYISALKRVGLDRLIAYLTKNT